MKNDNSYLKFIYYLFTFFLCVISAVPIFSILPDWQSLIFIFFTGLGLALSSITDSNIQSGMKKFSVLFLGTIITLALMKIPLQQSALPYLMMLFLLIIMVTSFIVEDYHRMGPIHFESIFFLIFSTCLPLEVDPRVQGLILSIALFIVLFLLQLTHALSSSKSSESVYVFTNINLFKRIMLSLLFTGIILGISWLLFFLVPKFSFKLNPDRAGSSAVDFKITQDAEVRLAFLKGDS